MTLELNVLNRQFAAKDKRLVAAWAMSHKISPVLVEPTGYSDVKDVLLWTQVAKIDNEIKYNELKYVCYALLTYSVKIP